MPGVEEKVKQILWTSLEWKSTRFDVALLLSTILAQIRWTGWN